MKTKILIFMFLCLASISVMGQGTVQRKKQQSNTQKPQKQSQKFRQQSTPTVKWCDICGKTLNNCDYGGKHPYCSTCGKLREKCEFGGKHPAEPINNIPAVSQETHSPQPAPEAAGYDVTFSCNVPSASLYIDGNANGTTNGTRFLKTGSHSIKVTANGYEDYSSSITVNRQNTSCSISLTRKAAPVFSNQTITVNGVSFQMIAVQGGTFTMGGTSEQGSDAEDDEKPTHSVTLSNYYIGKYEVTQELWQAVMGSNPSKFKGSKRPVEKVSWDDCQTFISKLNSLTGKRFRLPTEAEWEYAARGGDKSRGFKYSGSNKLDDVTWFYSYKTHDVGTKSPNELGVYDMSGNVWEWCQDWYGNYSSSSQTNPTGSNSGSNRVIRGGGWDSRAGSCRSSRRNSNTPDYRLLSIGLRLALSE